MRSFPAFAPVALPALLVSALVATVVAPAPAHGDPTQRGHQRHRGPTAHAQVFDTPLGYVQGTNKPQTSDGVIGQIAATVPAPLRSYGDTSQRAKWQVAPGVRATIWDERDARGPVREYLLAINYKTAGIKIDTMNNGPVRDVGTVPSMVQRAHAIAGVNGDFYDIGDTGAPLGIARNRQRGLLNGRLSGWNSAFYITKAGRPEIGPLTMRAVIRQRPGITITNLNSPSVKPDGIGLYNHHWGSASARVTDGVTTHVRTVLVRGGVVVRNKTRLPTSGPIEGQLLIGRGTGAAALASLKRGAKATIVSHLTTATKMALTGNQFLVRDGIIRVVDDREMAPRTAIGIDRDTHEILILVVDGRQSFSRGYTMVEMANQMIDLGADEALNLDGGGSSTMVARHEGATHVVNSPSDGFLRQVANGLAISYAKPKRGH